VAGQRRTRAGVVLRGTPGFSTSYGTTSVEAKPNIPMSTQNCPSPDLEPVQRASLACGSPASSRRVRWRRAKEARDLLNGGGKASEQRLILEKARMRRPTR